MDASASSMRAFTRFLDGFHRHPDRVAHGQRGGRAVGDDHHAVDTQQRTAAVGFVAAFFLERLERAVGQHRAAQAQRVALDLRLEPLGNGLGGGLDGLEHDVADEAVAQHHIEIAFKQVAAFDIADEMNARRLFEQLEGLLGECRALFLLLAVGHQPHLRVGDAQHVAREGGAHHRVGHEMLGLGIGVRPGVQNVAKPVLVGNGRRDARAVHSGKGAQFQRGGGHGGTGVAGGNESLGLAFLHHVHRDVDRRLLLAPHGFRAGLGHADGLGRVHDAHPPVPQIQALPRALGTQNLLVTHQKQVFQPRVIAQGVNRPSDVDGGRVVPAHGVQCDFHAGWNRELARAGGGPVRKRIRKITARDVSGRRSSECRKRRSQGFDIEHLAVTVVAARRAGDVRRHLAAALGAAFEDRCAPAVGATTHFLTAFGLAALWNGHGLAVS